MKDQSKTSHRYAHSKLKIYARKSQTKLEKKPTRPFTRNPWQLLCESALDSPNQKLSRQEEQRKYKHF